MERNLARLLKQKLPKLKRLFASDPRVLGVFLFGSQADRTATPRSDIDLAVLFERDLTLHEELGFEVAVSQALGTDDVDVLNLNNASLLFRRRAISGKLIYERDYVRVSDFIERVLIEYPDFEQLLDRFNADYFAGMRQDYARFRRPANQRTPKNNRKQLANARDAAR